MDPDKICCEILKLMKVGRPYEAIPHFLTLLELGESGNTPDTKYLTRILSEANKHIHESEA